MHMDSTTFADIPIQVVGMHPRLENALDRTEVARLPSLVRCSVISLSHN